MLKPLAPDSHPQTQNCHEQDEVNLTMNHERYLPVKRGNNQQPTHERLRAERRFATGF
jgi:hypothetical protein